jgi:hypothetical protein
MVTSTVRIVTSDDDTLTSPGKSLHIFMEVAFAALLALEGFQLWILYELTNEEHSDESSDVETPLEIDHKEQCVGAMSLPPSYDEFNGKLPPQEKSI